MPIEVEIWGSKDIKLQLYRAKIDTHHPCHIPPPRWPANFLHLKAQFIHPMHLPSALEILSHICKFVALIGFMLFNLCNIWCNPKLYIVTLVALLGMNDLNFYIFMKDSWMSMIFTCFRSFIPWLICVSWCESFKLNNNK